MVLARLSTIESLVWEWTFPNLSSLQNKYNTWQVDTGSPDKVFRLYVTRLRQSLILRRPKQEKKNKLRQFIGIANYYRDMWFRRSELLARFHWLASNQARSNLNGTHPINRPLIKSRKSMERRYFSAIQTSISLFTLIFTLMHQIISWGQSSYRIKRQ
jgi:hypothetical protein